MLAFLFLPGSVLAESIEVKLEKCIDGDSAKFKDSAGVVSTYRFLAIDAPNVSHPTKGAEPWGKEASEYVCNTLASSQKIVLEFDPNAPTSDGYDCEFVWVFVDDVLLQEQLVSLGYAKIAYVYGDYQYMSLLQEKEELAKSKKIGIWSEDLSEEKEEVEVSTESDNSSKNFFQKLFDSILDAITASINRMIDSILQKLEDML